MSSRWFATAVLLIAAAMLSASAAPAVTAASAPTLFNLRGGSPQILAGGAQKTWPITISEDRAFDAIFKGGMWLPNASGGRVYAKYDHHLLHNNGDWTWVGKVQTAHGVQSVVITFGKDAVFGRIPQPTGFPLRLTTAHGRTLLVQTDSDMLARSPIVLGLHATQDYKIPPRHKTAAPAQAQASSTTQAQTQDGTSSGPVIDVMVAYTQGLVSEYGTVSAALTRIDNLVDVTNQAYSDSQVHQSIRLVHTMQVNYTDANSDTTALDDLTGSDGTKPVPIPSGLQPVAPARTQYGADLVVMIRSFDNATDGGCGVGWLIGGGQQPIVPSQDYAFGYSVVSDGSDAGYYCLDSTFAHELGHNMGNAHDRAHADQPGAYSYSYGYTGNGTDGFATIMAYGGKTQTPLDVFSNPNISICQSAPCGGADTSSSSADNAHSMNNTASLIAQFEPTMVTTPLLPYTRDDVNGDGKSDLLWYSQSLGEMTYWLMNGATMTSWQELNVPNGYKPVATGDFDGNGRADILWIDSNKNLYMWLNNGDGTFTNYFITQYSGDWQVVGAADVDGDGKSDIFWYSKSAGELTYWLMNGRTMQSWRGFMESSVYWPVGFGDFDGDGRADILWTSANGSLYMWLDDGRGGFNIQYITQYDSSNWKVTAVADVDGDGKADIIWYSNTIGELTYWLMNGSTMRSWRGFAVSNIYWPVGTGDYDGDGRADILWTGTQNNLYIWLNDENGGFNTNFVVHYTSNWVPFN